MSVSKEKETPIRQAIRLAGDKAPDTSSGYKVLGEICGVAWQTVQKWDEKGSLPRTEYTGETEYAVCIAEFLEGAMTKEEILRRKSTKTA